MSWHLKWFNNIIANVSNLTKVLLGEYMITNDIIRKDFGVVMNLIKRQCAKIDSSRPDCAITPKQGVVLGFIYSQIQQGKDVFQKDIEKEFSLRRSTASEILALMEKNEIIRREQIKDDARMKKIVLAAKAKQYLRQIKKDSDGITDLAFKGVTEQEKEVLKNILQKVIKNLEE